MPKSNREMGATVVWGGSRSDGFAPDPLGWMAGMLIGESKANANPEPAVGMIYSFGNPAARDVVTEIADGRASLVDHADGYRWVCPIRELRGEAPTGIETPAGRVMVGERRRHPDGSVWRVVGIERDTFPGCSSTVVRAYDERETGRGGTYGPALVASWPLLSGPLAEAAKDAIRSPPTGIESVQQPVPAPGLVWRRRDGFGESLTVASVTADRATCYSGVRLTGNNPWWMRLDVLAAEYECIGVVTEHGPVMVGERRTEDDYVVTVLRVKRHDLLWIDDAGDFEVGAHASRIAALPLVDEQTETIERASARPSAEDTARADRPHPIAVLLAPLVYGEPGVSRSFAAEIDADLDEALDEPLVLSGGRWYDIVKADPYAAGREREQAIMLAAEAHQETARLAHARTDRNWTPKPSARTLALRSLSGEQTCAMAFAALTEAEARGKAGTVDAVYYHVVALQSGAEE